MNNTLQQNSPVSIQAYCSSYYPPDCNIIAAFVNRSHPGSVELLQGCPNFLAGVPHHLSDTESAARKMIYILTLNKFTYNSVLETDLQHYKACPRMGGGVLLWGCTEACHRPHLAPDWGLDTTELLESRRDTPVVNSYSYSTITQLK